MCRFIAYKGSAVLLDDLLFKPKFSLIQQSIHAKELEEPLNGDGFGLSWYNQEISPYPAVFVSTAPAWNNRNLKSIAPRITSPLIFAHVRAASMGDVSEANCHPFQFENWTFMHNGGIEGFKKIKRQIYEKYSPTIFDWLRGQTDSEHFFGLVMDKILPQKNKITEEGVVKIIQECISFIKKLKIKMKISEPTYLNTCISNGKFIIGTRYIDYPLQKTWDEKALSLYYSVGNHHLFNKSGKSAGPKKKSAIIASEKLTEFKSDWKPIPENHFVIIYPNLKAKVRPILAND